MALARENFRRIGENFACGIATAGAPLEKAVGFVEHMGTEKLLARAASTPPPNRLVAIGHFGNFELFAHFTRLLPDYRFVTTYRPLNPLALDKAFQSLREKSGCLFIERRRTQHTLGKLLREGGVMLGLLNDQHGGPRGVKGPFLGVMCSTSPAPAVLARRYRCGLFTAFCFRTGLGRWRIEVGDEIPLDSDEGPRPVEEVVRDMNAAFEAAVLRDPANWFWVHNRWRLAPRRRKGST